MSGFPEQGVVFLPVGTGDSTTIVIDDEHVTSSGSGRGVGRTAWPKWATACASRRSVFAKRPVARAKSRTGRGLTTAPGRWATPSSATSGASSPPVASTTITSGLSACIHPTSAPIPAASWANRRASPLGRTATSSAALATSVPTITSSASFLRPPVCSRVLPLRPGLAGYGLSRRLAQATVRVCCDEGRDDPCSSAASRDRGTSGLSHPCAGRHGPILHDFRDTRDLALS